MVVTRGSSPLPDAIVPFEAAPTIEIGDSVTYETIFSIPLGESNETTLSAILPPGMEVLSSLLLAERIHEAWNGWSLSGSNSMHPRMLFTG